MTRALRFTKAELANAARIASEYGVAVKLDRDGSLIFYPKGLLPNSIDNPEDAAATAFQRWKEQRNANKDDGHS